MSRRIFCGGAICAVAIAIGLSGLICTHLEQVHRYVAARLSLSGSRMAGLAFNAERFSWHWPEEVDFGRIDIAHRLTIDRLALRRVRATSAAPARAVIFAQGDRFFARAHLSREQWAVYFNMANLAVQSVSDWLPVAGFDFQDGFLRGTIAAQGRRAQGSLSADVELAQATLSHAALSPESLGPFTATIALRGQWDRAQQSAVIDSARISLGQLRIDVRGNLQKLPNQWADMTLNVAPLSCSAALASFPPGLLRHAQAMQLEGNIGLSFRGKLSVKDEPLANVSWILDPFGCNVIRDAPTADMLRIRDRDDIMLPGRRGQPSGWILGPRNPHFRRLAALSPHVAAAFLAAEDNTFYLHDGFDRFQIRRALAENLRGGRLSRGASTITQQLVKNLFLSAERTLGRKLEEAILTWRMEQILTKSRILELYLNMIHLGPGIRGVEQASQVYFGCSASDLNPLQAAFLGVIAPNPDVLAREMRQKIDAEALAKLRGTLALMRQNGHLTSADYRYWAAQTLSFKAAKKP